VRIFVIIFEDTKVSCDDLISFIEEGMSVRGHLLVSPRIKCVEVVE